MPKQKRDYEKLKKEFMQSKFTDLSSFIATKWVPYNRHTREYMKWWAKEKKELKARATERAIAKAESKLAEKLEPSSEFLLWNINKAIELTARKLEQMEEKDSINVKDLNTIRSMNRIQNWQPTTYVKEESDVNQNVRIEWIHIILWGNPADNSENNNPKEV
jgi:hypothetical protein